MAVASMIGGWVGAHGARRINQKFLKLIVVGIATAMTIWFFWRQS
jgi:uncharacterized membrane protein YfcA